MNRVEDYMNLPYKKTLVRNQDGTYFAYVKEFEGKRQNPPIWKWSLSLLSFSPRSKR